MKKPPETGEFDTASLLVDSQVFTSFDHDSMVEYIRGVLENGSLDEAIRWQRRLPPPANEEEASVYARLRANIADKLAAQGHAAGVFDVLQPYDTALSRVRLPILERALVSLKLGEAYCATLNYPSSVALLDEAIKYAGLAGDKGMEATARCQLGLVYTFLGEYVIAQEQLRAALKYFTKVGDKRGEALIYLYFGGVDSGLGEFEKSCENFNKCIALAEEIGDEALLGEAKVKLGTALMSQGKLRQAIILYETAVEEYEQRSIFKLAAQTYNNLAHSLILCGNWGRAEQLLEKSIALSRKDQDDFCEAMALAHFGLLYMLTGRATAAMPTLNYAIDLSRQIHSRECESFSQTNLGKLYHSTGEYKLAIQHLQIGLEIAQSINRIGYAIEAQLALAEIDLANGRLEQVEEGLQRAQKMLARQPNLPQEGKRLRIEGQLAIARGEEGLERLSRAMEIFEAFSLPLEKAYCFLERANTLKVKHGNLIKARADYERALRLFEQLGATRQQESVSMQLKELDRQLPRAGEASLEAMRQRIIEERKQLFKMIKGSRSREQVVKEMVEMLRAQYLADIVAAYEFDREGETKLMVANTELAYLKNSINRRVHAAIISGKNGWIPGRSMDEPLYLELLPINPEKQLAVAIWGAPRKLIHGELTHSLLEIAGELLTLAVVHEGRRVAFNEVESGRLKTFKALPELTYGSRKMVELTEQLLRIHSSDLTVLITGESGTGKDLVARAIHAVSERRARPFLPFNCTATPAEIAEAQLFGYRKGAFTGANIDYEGVIRAADGGTLLLDEIGDLNLSVQPKLLRFLQEGEIQPIGYARPIRVDVRVIASTNRDLETMVERGEFREDLYHRLNIIRIPVPPLRQRREEVLALAQSFLKQSCERTGKRLAFSSEALLVIESYDWPGNVRQLKNEIERIVAFASDDDTIEKFHLSPEILQATAKLNLSMSSVEKAADVTFRPGQTLEELLANTEKQIIIKAIKQCRGNIRRTAQMLGISRKGLYDKIKRLKIRYNN